MGAVYRGRHLRLEIDVAVKVMAPPPGLPPGETDAFVGRFIREGQTAASITHQNLIRVIDVNTEGGVYYLVMDFVEGESAADHLECRGRFTERQAVETCLGAAEGLAAAHNRGIVHRDVKPDNIMIGKDGTVRVADLGLAKAYGDGEGKVLASRRVSKSQQAMGTPLYMSPEQFTSARNVGTQADVWSLGVTLFHLLAGEPPWADGNVFALARKIEGEPLPDVRRTRPDISDGVWAIIEKATQKDLSQRYGDCGEMVTALRTHLNSIGGPSGSLVPDGRAGETGTAVGPEPPDSKTLTLIGMSLLAWIFALANSTPIPTA
jgi:serine/threonine protein kinase